MNILLTSLAAILAAAIAVALTYLAFVPGLKRRVAKAELSAKLDAAENRGLRVNVANRVRQVIGLTEELTAATDSSARQASVIEALNARIAADKAKRSAATARGNRTKAANRAAGLAVGG